jgi:hypothetical protein
MSRSLDDWQEQASGSIRLGAENTALLAPTFIPGEARPTTVLIQIALELASLV